MEYKVYLFLVQLKREGNEYFIVANINVAVGIIIPSIRFGGASAKRLGLVQARRSVLPRHTN